MSKYSIIKSQQIDHIYSEVTLQACCDFPFLTKLVGFDQDESSIYIFQEFVQGGEFFTYLRNKGSI